MRRGSALPLGLLLATLSCCSDDTHDLHFGPSRVLDARPLPPLEPLALEPGSPTLSFFALGDTGWAGDVLRDVSAAMDRSHRERPARFVLLLGDNFYPKGIGSLHDERWRTHFEDAFALPVPFHPCLGNHDHKGDVDAQIAWSQRSARWRLPARWYSFSHPVEAGVLAQVFVLDTLALAEGGLGSVGDQLEWLERELAASTARWKIVAGHHPALSHGSHGGATLLAERVGPLFEKFGVDVYLAGHDHDLQVLRSRAGWVQVVSGAGSSTRDTRWGEDTLYAGASPGFARVSLARDEMWIEIETADGGTQFRRRVRKSPRLRERTSRSTRSTRSTGCRTG